MQKQELGLEIGQMIWFRREESNFFNFRKYFFRRNNISFIDFIFLLENIYQEAVIESFREGDLDLLVSWSHGFGLQARRKIFVYEILWTIPLDNVPWPGNEWPGIFPSAPEPPEISVSTQNNQKESLFFAKKIDIIFQLFVSFANNWKTFCFILSQIVFMKEIFNNYHSSQVI
jgi:hypothetical protein